MGHCFSQNSKVAVVPIHKVIDAKKRSKSIQLFKNASLAHKVNKPASIQELNLSLLCCQLCKLFQNCLDATVYENQLVDFLNVKINRIKEWKTKNDYNNNGSIEAKVITGVLSLSAPPSIATETEINISMPFVLFDMSVTEFEKLNSMSMSRMTTTVQNDKPVATRNNSNDEIFKIGKVGNLFLECYENLRATGLMEWIKEATAAGIFNSSSNDDEGAASDCLITGHGMGGGLANLLMAEIAVHEYKKVFLKKVIHEEVGDIIVDEDCADETADFAKTGISSLSPQPHQQQRSRTKSVQSTMSEGVFTTDGNEDPDSVGDKDDKYHDDKSKKKKNWFPYLLITFGSPRAFSKPTAEKLLHIGLQDRVFRFINVGDILPFYLDSTSRYGHIGTAFVYDPNTISINTATKARSGSVDSTVKSQNAYQSPQKQRILRNFYVHMEKDLDFDGYEECLKSPSTQALILSQTTQSNSSNTAAKAAVMADMVMAANKVTDYTYTDNNTSNPHSVDAYINYLQLCCDDALFPPDPVNNNDFEIEDMENVNDDDEDEKNVNYSLRTKPSNANNNSSMGTARTSFLFSRTPMGGVMKFFNDRSSRGFSSHITQQHSPRRT